MKTISSSSTWFIKKVFPAVWFGFLAFFVVSVVSSGAFSNEPIFIAVPCLMAAFGFFLFRTLIWTLADEVVEYGDYLIVRFGSEEDRIDLSNVMNVSVSTNAKPPRITLRLVQPGRFGNDVSFAPASPLTLNPFAKNPIAEDLMVRVDRARSRRAS